MVIYNHSAVAACTIGNPLRLVLLVGFCFFSQRLSRHFYPQFFPQSTLDKDQHFFFHLSSLFLAHLYALHKGLTAAALLPHSLCINTRRLQQYGKPQSPQQRQSRPKRTQLHLASFDDRNHGDLLQAPLHSGGIFTVITDCGDELWPLTMMECSINERPNEGNYE